MNPLFFLFLSYAAMILSFDRKSKWGQTLKYMRLENQVCTLLQAKRLKELGLSQNSVWYWETMKRPVMEGCCTERLQAHFNISHPIGRGVVENLYSAFTASELSDLLPTHITFEDEQYFFSMLRGSKRWHGEWRTNKKDIAINSEGELDRPRKNLWNTHKSNKFIVNILAEWVIALIENKVIDVNEINRQITSECQ